MRLLRAVSADTGETVATLEADEAGVYTLVNGEHEAGLAGPFANAAFHVANKLLAQKFGPHPPTIAEARAKGWISDMDIVKLLPLSYGSFNFIPE